MPVPGKWVYSCGRPLWSLALTTASEAFGSTARWRRSNSLSNTALIRNYEPREDLPPMADRENSQARFDAYRSIVVTKIADPACAHSKSTVVALLAAESVPNVARGLGRASTLSRWFEGHHGVANVVQHEHLFVGRRGSQAGRQPLRATDAVNRPAYE